MSYIRVSTVLVAMMGLALAVVLSISLASDAEAGKRNNNPRPVDLQSTVAESGYNETFSGVGDTAPINGSPFTYATNKKFTSLTQVNIRLTMADGDTLPSQSDYNQLTLGLDGYDTGILLNGFDGDGVTTLIVGGAPNNATRIIAALNKDHRLNATVISHDEGGNRIELPATSNTTLQLIGTAVRARR